MAVRTHKLAFLNLRQNTPAAVPVDEPPDIISFRRTRQMIPMHRRRMEPPAAIDARSVLEQP